MKLFVRVKADPLLLLKDKSGEARRDSQLDAICKRKLATKRQHKKRQAILLNAEEYIRAGKWAQDIEHGMSGHHVHHFLASKAIGHHVEHPLVRLNWDRRSKRQAVRKVTDKSMPASLEGTTNLAPMLNDFMLNNGRQCKRIRVKTSFGRE